MIYTLILLPEAETHLKEWSRSGQKKIVKKILALFDELRTHPASGTGKVEQLKGDYTGLWSRRIDKGARLIYRIWEDKVIVTVISLKGHYGDK